MSDNDRKITGYVNATHMFGRSKIVRLGRKYYLQWQWQYDVHLTQIITLTQAQYTHVKKMLGPIVKETIVQISDHAKTIKNVHKHTSLYYMRVKRYLKKEGLI
jgi:hypothetical protein